MYHPTRGGVRGGRDQFTWDDVKVDKHRENYLGHSVKAPVGRWQKGKDLNWYARDKASQSADMEAAKEEIRRIKEEEEQAMREALGLAPKRANRPQGNRLDKHEFSELVKRGSTAEDIGAGHAEAVHVHGLGFSKAHRPHVESDSLRSTIKEDVPPEMPRSQIPNPPTRNAEEESSEDESSRKKRKREERKQEKHERREKREKHDKRERRDRRHSSDDKRKHKKEKERRRRHGSDSD